MYLISESRICEMYVTYDGVPTTPLFGMKMLKMFQKNPFKAQRYFFCLFCFWFLSKIKPNKILPKRRLIALR